MKGKFEPQKPIRPFSILANLMNSTEGRFFSIEYVKKDGSLRRLNGRIYEKMNPDKDFKHLIVWDVQRKGYRKIDYRKIRAFKCAGFQIGVFSNE